MPSGIKIVEANMGKQEKEVLHLSGILMFRKQRKSTFLRN
jgi:hypothetical protein